MRLSEVLTEREADGASVRLSGALGRGAHRDEEEKRAGPDDMATIRTSSQVEDVSASTCSPTSILEPRSYRQRPWSSKLAARQQVGSSCCEPESSTVVEVVSLAEVLKLQCMSMRSYLQLDSTSES